MPLDRLLATLRADAERSAEALRSAAEAEAAGLLAQAAAAAGSARDAALRDLERRERAEAAMRLGAARLAGMRRVLEARSRLLERVFAEAGNQARAGLRPFPSAPTRRIRLERATAAVGGGGAVVQDAAGGFVVSSADGRVTVPETFDAHLSRRRPALAQMIIRRVDQALM